MTINFNIKNNDQLGEFSLPRQLNLNAWWKDAPSLSLESSPQGRSPVLPSEIEPHSIEGSHQFRSFSEGLRTRWNRMILAANAKLATPSIVIGMLLIIIGIGGCITVLSGFDIPGLEVIIHYMPISIVFSLTLIRGGIHAIYRGVNFARVQQRSRQEVEQFYRLQYIKGITEGQERTDFLHEAQRQNRELAPSMRLHHLLGQGDLHGKETQDLPSARLHSYHYRLEIQKMFVVSNKLEAPQYSSSSARSIGEVTIPDHVEKKSSSCFDGFYNWWYKKLPLLGACDMILGQIMLVMAMAGLFFLLKPSLVPDPLGILAKDPSISIACSFLFLNHWVSCTQTGWRMLTYQKREEKRAQIEADLKVIDIGLEKQRVHQFHDWLIENVADKSLKNALKGHLETFDNAINDSLKNRTEVTHLYQKGTLSDRLHKWGKGVIPSLATPARIFGILLSLLGILCLSYSIAGKIPDFLEVLAKNNPLSAVFGAALISVGLHAFYRGVSIKERSGKNEAKKHAAAIREAFIEKLYPDLPKATARSNIAFISSQKTFEIPQEEKQASPKITSVQNSIQYLASSMQEKASLWTKSLKVLWIPDTILAGFLLFSSITGLVCLYGGYSPPEFAFILQNPSFSTAFCVSMLIYGIDSIISSWRSGSYNWRKADDRTNINIISDAYLNLDSRNKV